MQNNNDNNGHGGHDMKMMWLMMLPCILLPIIFLLISGKGLSAFSWQLFAGIAFMVAIHGLMMKFMHSPDNEKAGARKEENKEIK